MINNHPSQREPIEQTLHQAQTLQQAGRHQEAEQLYLNILKIQAHHPEANYNLGILAMQAQQPIVAVDYFMTALEHNPSQKRHWLSAIDALIQVGMTDAAEQLLSLGQQQGLQGEEAEALTTRLQAYVQEPATPSNTAELVELFNQGRYQAAANLAETMTTNFPDYGFGWKVLGAALKQMGRTQDALKPMQQAATLLPNDADAHSNLGDTLKDLGQFNEAKASCHRALQINPDYAEAHNNLGNIHYDQGQLTEAEACYRQALKINPHDAKVHHNLGNTLYDLRQLELAQACYQKALELNPTHTEVYNSLAVALLELGRINDAETACRQALDLNPNYLEAHTNLGIILQEQGRFDLAEASYRRALAINPDHAETHHNLSNTLQSLDRLDEAKASSERAIELKPDYAEAHNILATIYQKQKLFNQAEQHYRLALTIKPDFAVAYCNLGCVLQELNRLDEAKTCYLNALEIKPDLITALNNFALLLNAEAQPKAALNYIKQSLQIKETTEAKHIFAACVKRLRFNSDDSTLKTLMVKALTEPWGHPKNLAQICADLIKLNPDIKQCIIQATEASAEIPAEPASFGTNSLKACAADPLLLGLLHCTPNCDIEIERFLTMARYAMLKTAVNRESLDNTALVFYSALANQCFINEYIFSYRADEIQLATELRDCLTTALATQQPISAIELLAVAAYFPLNAIPSVSRLLERIWPETVTTVLKQQISEPDTEQQLRSTIPRLIDIDDKISLLVQRQYEENPYPCWTKLPYENAQSITDILQRKFPLAGWQNQAKKDRVDVLIAGCGTGQHPIATAQLIKGAQVLAIDLSLTSLSYAKRKTQELGLSNIEYAQADLLKLGALGRNFDVIESHGVLHHLEDPWAGWLALLPLLRPGGFMGLGFYSKIARRNIVRIQNLIKEQGFGSTAAEIRRCRQTLFNLDASFHLEHALSSPDFYNTSTCRDLLFHVQEQQMTLTDINAFIANHQLRFLGFDIDADILHAYRLRFPEDPAACKLSLWEIFEQENPDTFSGMYQLWLQKTGDDCH